MKLQAIFLSSLLVMSHLIGASGNHGAYYSELKELKQREDTKMIFDEDAHNDLSMIHRDIIAFKELTSFQRFVRSIFLSFDVVVVTPETMPKLYTYVENVCQKGGIAMPTVFVTRHKSFFNAFAQKLLMSTGGIVIGQKLLKELSDGAIEAVVAHEIGHIKYNHINKMLALQAIKVILSILCLKSEETPIFALCGGTSVLMSLLINKRFEKEADAFACDVMGKNQGLIEFFELLKEKEQKRENEFILTYNALQQNKQDLTKGDYNGLMFRYYLTKFGHNISKAMMYLYYETPFGAHPSHQARIDAAKKSLKAQQA